ncbi:Hypothetical predicted protein [Paramuricea clavata]|uniref:Uncharacterized protein n=1 Tax=Paramuricea clavata TaxID=317549 RepID=A0A6S7IIZ8_PARCT|nr:Hypothetical predicted protein [Paramuricea clavata]
MRRSSLPNVKDNLVITRPNVRFPQSPNVSRSWEPRDVVARVRAEERLARSVGDRGEERKVLEWCKKHNVNVIRKLPKLDSTILTSRGMNTEKFMSFVDEAKMVEREQPVKPPDYSKERTPSAEHREEFCKFCERELPKKKRRRRNPKSPYECEHCGTSNDIYDDSDGNISESESEDNPAVSESVRDTIRRGNTEEVIDHRTFLESYEKSENFSQKLETDIDNDDSDIFWRNESDFDSFHGNFEEQMNLNDNEDGYNGTVFLTETTLGNHGNKPVEVKMAWDDDSSNQFAEISRTIATDDGIEADDVTSQESFDVTSERSRSRNSDDFEKSESNCENLENLFPESDSKPRLSPTPPSHKRRGSSPRTFRFGDHHRSSSSGEVHVTTLAGESESNDMTQSPIANRSVGLTRVALMRLGRQGRARTRGCRSSPGTPQHVARTEEPRSHSYDPHDSYSFLDAVSPEIKSVHERQNRPDSADSQNS